MPVVSFSLLLLGSSIMLSTRLLVNLGLYSSFSFDPKILLLTLELEERFFYSINEELSIIDPDLF